MSKPEWQLTKDQQLALDLAMEGYDLFITGEAGSGKTTLVELIIKRKEEQGYNVTVCAPTGIAAMNIGGVTIHAAFGFPAGSYIDDEGDHPPRLKINTNRIRSTDVLIIDELSMTRCDLADALLASVLQAEAETGRRIQKILVGDMAQIPPVATEQDKKVLERFYGIPMGHAYAFQGKYFGKCEFKPVFLREVVRQDDKEFARQLSLLRRGDPSCLPYFNSRVGIPPPPGIVSLHAINAKVNEANRQGLDRLPGREYVFTTSFSYEPGFSQANVDRALLNTIEKELVFKVQAPIIFTSTAYSNHEVSRLPSSVEYSRQKRQGPLYVNGMTGTIVDVVGGDPSSSSFSFIVRTIYGDYLEVAPVSRPVMGYVEENGRYVRRKLFLYLQFPFKLAFSQSIHKSQGTSLKAALIDPYTFSPGMLYVALSRLRSLEGLYLTRPIREEDIKTDSIVKEFYDRLEKMAGVSGKRGRPPKNTDGSKRTKEIHVPLPLKNHVKEEIRQNSPLPLEDLPAYSKGRVNMRISEKLYDHVKYEIDLWKKAVRGRKE